MLCAYVSHTYVYVAHTHVHTCGCHELYIRTPTDLELHLSHIDVSHIYVYHTYNSCISASQGARQTGTYIQIQRTLLCHVYTYGVATISRLLKTIGLFCKRTPYKRQYSSKETCNFKEPTHRSPIAYMPYVYIIQHICHMSPYVYIIQTTYA